MKVSSIRSDIVVAGGGIPGVCAAISAARQGANVCLIERDAQLGGRHTQNFRFPFDQKFPTSFPSGRESGLLDEICLEVSRHNLERSHLGLSRVLDDLVRNEKRISLLLNHHLAEANMNADENLIESLLFTNNDLKDSKNAKGKYFIDCTESSQLSRLVNALEPMAERTSNDKQSTQFESEIEDFSIVITLARGTDDTPFEPPAWIPLKWEENSILAKLEIMESLNRSIEGDHLVEWKGPVSKPKISSSTLAWCVWDYLKNRSSISSILGPYFIDNISEYPISRDDHRGKSVKDLSLKNIISGAEYPDSIAVARIPIPGKEALTFSSRGKISLPHPFEIPLQSLRSQKVSNLFWIGDNILCPSDESIFLGHTPTLSLMGCAGGVSTALLSQSESSFKHASFYKKVRSALTRTNQQVGINFVSDSKNKAKDAKTFASSTLQGFTDEKKGETGPIQYFNNCLLQFPIVSSKIQKLDILLEIPFDCKIEFKLHQGSSNYSAFPGKCLFTDSILFAKNSHQWVTIQLDVSIEKPGWHFMELKSAHEFGIHSQDNPPPGLSFLQPTFKNGKKSKNPFSDFEPIQTKEESVPIGPNLRTSPPQSPFSSSNVINPFFRPTEVPNLWVSQNTDFKYAEFIELTWTQKISISCVEISFDAGFNHYHSNFPKSNSSNAIRSIVKDYNLFFTDNNGHGQKILEVRNNQKAFVIHEFEKIETASLEIEILSTNGIERAQIFQVRVF